MEGHLSDDPLYAFTEHDYGGRYDGFIPVPPGIGTECGSSVENWSDTAVSFLLLSSALSVILFGFLYRADCEERLEYRQVRAPQRMDGNSILWISVASIAFSMVGNNLIDISPLPELSGSYEETSAMLMSGSLILQLLCVGILAPIVEEILMRGIIFGRLRDMMRPAWAIFWGGLLFGIFHGNIVQGVYASFLAGSCAGLWNGSAPSRQPAFPIWFPIWQSPSLWVPVCMTRFLRMILYFGW